MDLEERIMLAIVRISESFKKKNSALFKQNGLTFSQYNVLRILESAETGRMSISEIGNMMLVSGANMTGIVRRLEKVGFIAIERLKSDERVKLLSIQP
ncbi:MAG: MarR family transcriptional regulator, partial [bacterium]